MTHPCNGYDCPVNHPGRSCMEYNRSLDQLDIQCEMARRDINAMFHAARRRLHLEPR